jgi:hypothetical protein
VDGNIVYVMLNLIPMIIICFIVLPRGGKLNWQHNYALYKLTSVGYGHYR